MLFSILENAFFQGNLGSGTNGKSLREMLLQSPDCFHRRILLTRRALGNRLLYTRFFTIGLYLLTFGPQAVA